MKCKFSIKITLLLSLGLYSCVNFDSTKIKNLNNKIIKIGHAGSGFSSWIPFNPLPSNSMASIKKALEEDNADGIEIDIHMTADGRFVLFHDQMLDSKSNLKGCIENKSYREVVAGKYQLGVPFDWFQEERIIGLDELFTYLKGLAQFPLLHLDVRHHSNCFDIQENSVWQEKIMTVLVKYLSEKDIPKEKVLIISNSKASIWFLKESNSTYPYSIEEDADFDKGMEWVLEHKIPIMTIKPRLLTPEKSATAHEKGIQIITFGAKSKSGVKQLLELNPDYIQTNNLRALNDLLEN